MIKYNDSERTMLYCGSFFVVVICHPVDISFVGKMKKIYQGTILDKKAVQKNGIKIRNIFLKKK